MSSRPAPPPPIARWPFVAGASVLFAVAAYLLLMAGRPPAIGPLVFAIFLTGASILVSVIPFILDNERRLRLAEAAVRENAEAQLRRLAQTADQLTHVVSRGQSTEEQAGRALGTLEEVAERMVAQAEELAAALGRAGERENSARDEEIRRLVDERDQKLAAWDARWEALSVSLSEAQAALKRSTAATTRSVESLAARLEAVAGELRTAIASPPEAALVPKSPDTPARRAPIEPPPAEPPRLEPEPEPAAPTATEPAVPEGITPPVPTDSPPAERAAPEEIRDQGSDEPSAPHAPESRPDDERPAAELATPDAPAEAVSPPAEAAPPPRPHRKPRHARAVEKPVEDAAPAPAEPAGSEPDEPAKPVAALELALEGMPEPRPLMRLNRREPPGSTSLVATAYIGIGNKLYLRGDGPGLSWERGVPMQFLAIGKWGWTTTEAGVPVTCRVYRNDDTPMLEENIVIDPGTKAEITPKF